MKSALTGLTVLLLQLAQVDTALATGPATGRSEFDPSAEYPYGRPNPSAPEELAQFAFLIGHSDCTEKLRTPNSNDWVDGTRSWDAYYTLNGYAIMDGGVASRGANGNMRIYDPAIERWKVTFFSTPVVGAGVWIGGMSGTSVVLERSQQAPGSNIDGISRLTFSEITPTSFEWLGEWVSADESVQYPFWTISCRKVRD